FHFTCTVFVSYSYIHALFSLFILRPPSSTLFPYTTLFRSREGTRCWMRSKLLVLALFASSNLAAGAAPKAPTIAGCPIFPASNPDRKSTRLNSSHQIISYAVFCLKKKKQKTNSDSHTHSLH